MFTRISPILMIDDINEELNIRNIGKEFGESIVKLYNTINSWLNYCKHNEIVNSIVLFNEKYRNISVLIDDVYQNINDFTSLLDESSNIKLNEYFDNDVDMNPLLSLIETSKLGYDSYMYYSVQKNVKQLKNKTYYDIIRDCDMLKSIKVTQNSNYKYMILYKKQFLYTDTQYTINNNDCYCYWPLIITYSNEMKFLNSKKEYVLLPLSACKYVSFTLEINTNTCTCTSKNILISDKVLKTLDFESHLFNK